MKDAIKKIEKNTLLDTAVSGAFGMKYITIVIIISVIIIFIPFIVALLFTTSLVSGFILFFLLGIVFYLTLKPLVSKKKHLKNFKIEENHDNNSENIDIWTLNSNGEEDEIYKCIPEKSIINKKGFYDEGLIKKVIEKQEQINCIEHEKHMQERKRQIQERIKSQDCNGLTARCSICKYLWVIRKPEGIPASCPKCGKKKVRVLPKDN